MTLAPPEIRVTSPRVERFSEVVMPYGTVTVLFDWGMDFTAASAVIEIFAEHHPHPADWTIMVGLLHKITFAELGEPDYLNGVDYWRIPIRYTN